ncbi:unnamed protein product [Polarella glacialis]|uniref:Uncharacterized protein n=1 Tax=Polarella glacialis TaxID=89957 RepID=A0A813KRD9_POLGL|nr:unnamed protein product [Polarella glacialis]
MVKIKKRKGGGDTLEREEVGVSKGAAAPAQSTAPASISAGSSNVQPPTKKLKKAKTQATVVAGPSANAAATGATTAEAPHNGKQTPSAPQPSDKPAAVSPTVAPTADASAGDGGSSKSAAKKLKKAAAAAAEKAAAEAAASSRDSGVGKAPIESIDDIFAKRKSKDPPAAEPKAAKGASSQEKKKKKAPRRGSAEDPLGMSADWVDDGLGGVYNVDGWTNRRTGDGMRIFKTHLLKVGDGGGTPQCPFDCDCCF